MVCGKDNQQIERRGESVKLLPHTEIASSAAEADQQAPAPGMGLR